MSAVALTADKTFLKTVKLFSELGSEGLDKLASCLKRVEFRPYEVIASAGTTPRSMYIIRSGLVEVRKGAPETRLLARLGEREVVGEMSVWTGRTRSATVIAVEETSAFMLTQQDFQNLLKKHREIYIGLARILRERLELANERTAIEYINLSKCGWDPSVVALLPQKVCLHNKMVPIAKAYNSLTLAMVNPTNLRALDDVRNLIKGVTIEPRICSLEDFNRFMETVYPELAGSPEEQESGKRSSLQTDTEKTSSSLDELEDEIINSRELEVVQDEEDKPSTLELAHASEEAPIVKLTNGIIALAIKKGASDIHIEPAEDSVALRLRIDGVLREERVFSKKIQLALTSRFKILSRLDIAQRRMPQDGRFSIKSESRVVDLRVSTVPAKFGENLVMRILDKGTALLELDKVIVHRQTAEKIRKMINQPFGIIYVTGPTGSGKTTTLYSLMNQINSRDIKISTAEDPIEYNLPGLCQVQTHADIGLNFAHVLRAFLRQDPDVILVGETRDRETAKISVEAAITGHLVFTTLHTNDAPSSFARLQEMGVEPFMVANSTIGVVAQRLARRICPDCKVRTNVDEMILKFFGYTEENAPPFYKGAGCANCDNSGKKGRIAIYELLVMNDELKRAVANGANTHEIHDLAVKNGMKTLKEYGMFLMAEGLTTVDEVLANLVIED